MGFIETRIEIAASPERVFDAARDIDLHVQSQQASGERAVAGVTSGLIGLGEEVTFEARHFGLRLRHRARITALERPRRFVDEMVEGAFAEFRHEHLFEPIEQGTLMIDRLQLRAPLGPLGRCVEILILDAYLRRLLEERARALKTWLEASD